MFITLCVGCLKSYANNFQQQPTEIEEIKKIKDFKKIYALYTSSPIYGNSYVENIEDWIIYFEDKIKVNKNKDDVIFLEFILIHLYRISNNIDKSIKLGLQTYYKNKKRNALNKLLCKLLQELETCYYLKNNNLELIRLNKEKFKICGKNEIVFHNIYFNMGLYDLALKSYKEHINYNTSAYKKHNLYAQAFHKNDFGVYFMYDQKIDSALYYYKKSIALFHKQIEKDATYRKGDIAFMMGIVKGNIATCFLNQKKYEQAIPLYLEEIKESRIYYKGLDWIGFEKVYQRIASCYIQTNQFKKANFYINGLKNYKNRFYKLKSEYYTKLKNKDSTLFYNKKYISISDSIFKEEMKQQKIESLGVLELSDQLKTQKKQINILEEEDLNKDILIKLISIIGGVIILSCLLLLYLYIGKNKRQKLVEIQKNEIEIALTNNKTLLKELNHRVKNNLQMVSSVISLQASKIKDEGSKKHFNSAINRIKVLSKIHNSLYAKNQLYQIDLLNYIIILKNYLVNSIINPEIEVDFKIDIPANLYVNKDKKTTIGLIINELITNSLKYAFNTNNKNIIKIAISKKDEYYHFFYADNGKGFNYKEIDTSKSIGLNLIKRLVNQLGEEAIITSDVGMNIRFKFKN